jgi:hypothetical protein
MVGSGYTKERASSTWFSHVRALNRNMTAIIHHTDHALHKGGILAKQEGHPYHLNVQSLHP